MGQGLRHALLMCAVALSVMSAQAADSRTPQPVIEPARAGTQCIADPATMRRDHPAMLEHQRDLTVRSGIRGAGPPQAANSPRATQAGPFVAHGGRREASGGPTSTAKTSLKACIACHASPATGSVAKSETNFCISCHAYTAVRIDCFGCHATQPQGPAPHPLVPAAPQAAATRLP